jgi:hypothetical protein
MESPPNWLTMVGIAVEMMVPSTAARKILSIMPSVIVFRRFLVKTESLFPGQTD